MSLPLRVLGSRVLIRPDVNTQAPVQTDSGVYLATSLAAAIAGEDPRVSLCRGTVVAVGRSRHPRQDEAERVADILILLKLKKAANLMRDLVRPTPCVRIGDDVIYAPDAGQETAVDGDPYVILREDELLAIIEPEHTAA